MAASRNLSTLLDRCAAVLSCEELEVGLCGDPKCSCVHIMARSESLAMSCAIQLEDVEKLTEKLLESRDLKRADLAAPRPTHEGTSTAQ